MDGSTSLILGAYSTGCELARRIREFMTSGWEMSCLNLEMLRVFPAGEGVWVWAGEVFVRRGDEAGEDVTEDGLDLRLGLGGAWGTSGGGRGSFLGLIMVCNMSDRLSGSLTRDDREFDLRMVGSFWWIRSFSIRSWVSWDGWRDEVSSVWVGN